MRFLSICSGIEAVTAATAPLGWQPVAFAEIEPFPSAVLAHHHPQVPNLGDMTAFRTWDTDLLAQADVLVGGTPCQDFSVAGLRASLSGDRGNLTLTLIQLYDYLDTIRHLHGRPPAVLLWENVPGILNTPDNAFGSLLAGLAGEDHPLSPPGGKWQDAGYVCGPVRSIAWRILDAQYFGLAQRRRRVFLVAGPRDGFHPESVLFELSGLQRHTPPRRETGENTPAGTLRSTDGGVDLDHARAGHIIASPLTTNPYADNLSEEGKLIPEIQQRLAFGGNNTSGPIQVSTALNAHGGPHGRLDFESETFIQETAHTLRAEGFDASEDGTGRGTPLIPELIAFPERMSSTQCASTPDLSPSLQALNPTAIAFSARERGDDGRGYDRQPLAMAFHENQRGELTVNDTAGTLKCNGGKPGQGYPALLTQEWSDPTSPPVNPENLVNPVQNSLVAYRVRRLTPTECERLQGFPDHHTRIPWRGKPAAACPDGPRYKALGNSMAVPVIRWICHRLPLGYPQTDHPSQPTQPPLPCLIRPLL